MSQITSFGFIKPEPFQPCVLSDPVEDQVQAVIRIYDPEHPEEFIRSRHYSPLLEQDIDYWVSKGVETAENMRKYLKEYKEKTGHTPKTPTVQFLQNVSSEEKK